MLKSGKGTYLCLVLLLICFVLAGCAGEQSSATRDPEYESQKIVVEGDIEQPKEITVGEMRTLPQQKLDASLTRTTGLLEEFKASGPTVKDVLEYMGINYQDYKGIGFTGRDNYYCLVTPEIMAERELILALTIDGQSKLPEELRPARLCVQGEFGPYWVKMVDRIVLYKEIPEKNITSVWVFKNLAEGIEPYQYEYYGSKDDAIELAQIFSRFDNVSSKAFFTMKSSDGFKKNEAINMVSKNYYIKIEGEGAPMNMAPNIKLGMNVMHMAWFSTNADAAIFPEEIVKLTGEEQVGDQKGISLRAILEEIGLKDIDGKQFEVIGTDGNSVKVSGEDLNKGVLLTKDDGSYPVVWTEGEGLSPIANLLRIRSI
ncbi:MAG: molybdopterin-dependent oxidoreductase [Peptococcaceae bacterium MAG4]|nr:molybdopterin-dependent oxidoreductase [Peptococcaceae bacterium MAG4]NLW37136.1 molybdopterin-dependent oxidoreductase [Peptococcaceae bacterium]